MNPTIKVPCDQCGEPLDPSTAALAYNLGAGPEYFCRKCKPPGSVAEAVATIKTFMGFAE